MIGGPMGAPILYIIGNFNRRLFSIGNSHTSRMTLLPGTIQCPETWRRKPKHILEKYNERKANELSGTGQCTMMFTQ